MRQLTSYTTRRTPRVVDMEPYGEEPPPAAGEESAPLPLVGQSLLVHISRTVLLSLFATGAAACGAGIVCSKLLGVAKLTVCAEAAAGASAAGGICTFCPPASWYTSSSVPPPLGAAIVVNG